MNDLKFAFHQLLKNLGFTAVAALSLSLGIAANTTTPAETDPNGEVPPRRSSPLDEWKTVADATKDLRLGNGNISAEPVSNLFGISLSANLMPSGQHGFDVIV